ncbi:MAG: peptidylprolyl isomerase [Capsulimonadaceae bacterium]
MKSRIKLRARGLWSARALIVAVGLVATSGIAFAQSSATAVTAGPATGKPHVVASGVAATVDGHVIPMADAVAIAMREDAASATNQLIENYLVDKEAARVGVTVTPAELKQRVDGLRKVIAPHTLDEGLKQHHETLAQLEDEFRHQIERERLLLRTVTPPPMVHIREIVIGLAPATGSMNDSSPHTPDQAKVYIKTILQLLARGKTFSDLAKGYSTDPQTGPNGGDAGIAYTGCRLDPMLVQAALKLKPGEVTQEPIQALTGFVLLQAVSTGESHSPDEDLLYTDAADAYTETNDHGAEARYIQGLRAQARIVNNVP